MIWKLKIYLRALFFKETNESTILYNRVMRGIKNDCKSGN